MSDILTVKLTPLHGIIAALVLLAGGSGVLVISCRNSGRTGETDPEVIELVVPDTVEGSGTLDAGDAADAST